MVIPGALKRFLYLVGATNDKYNQDNCPMLVAALAYHSFFSIFPLLLFLIYIGSQLLSPSGVYEVLNSGLIEFLPTGGDTISQVLSATTDLRGSIGLVGIVGLLWSASSVFTVLETALNRIWGARPRGFWRKRLVATVSILVLSFLFLTSVTLGQFLPRLLSLIRLPELQWLGSLMSFLFLVFVLTIFYTAFPNRRVPRRPAILAGLVVGVSLLGARFLFDLFLNSTVINYGTVYGSLAWMVSLALWAYVVATLFLLGAEFGSVLELEAKSAS
ncbi:MAG: YihY/virulence factor BrkB family protein [Anaerolineales bacterium]